MGPKLDQMPTISPSEHTPAEIWHYTLQFSIFVPIFFSIDPASHGIDTLHKYGDDSLYWETERARNALRRVCRSWDAFLNRFARRLVRLVDVEHGHVPISALRNAIRIQTLACHCRKPRVDLHQPWPTLDYIRKDGTPEPWKLQILFGFWEDNTAHPKLFLVHHRLKHLRVFHRTWSHSGYPSQAYNSTNQNDQPITVLSVLGSTSIAYDTTKLTTWRLHLRRGIGNEWSLSHLRHLWVHSLDDQVMESLLPIVGPQLLSFSCFESRVWKQLLNIWELCPNITTLCIPRGLHLLIPPSSGHPIKTLGVHPGLARKQLCTVCRCSHISYQSKFPSIANIASAGISRLKLMTVWKNNPISSRDWQKDYDSSPKLCFRDQARIHGIQLVDAHSRTFSNWSSNGWNFASGHILYQR